MNFHEPYEILVNRLEHRIQLTFDYPSSPFAALNLFLYFRQLVRWSSYRYIGMRMESGTIAELFTFFIKINIRVLDKIPLTNYIRRAEFEQELVLISLEV